MLVVDALEVAYGRIRALKGVSLDVRSGEIVAMVGGNGAGKSTLLRAISGVVPAAGGRIQFGPHRLDGMTADRIVGLGVCHVPEGRQIFAGLTVRENLEMGAYLRRDRAGVLEDMERMFAVFPRLRERRDQLGGTLSGGEQQMLAIARGLMARPKVLLLDEPSLGIAPLLIEEIFDIIEAIRAEGTPILVVEQNANLALSVADRGYVLETGSVVLTGRAQVLLDDPHVKRAYLGG